MKIIFSALIVLLAGCASQSYEQKEAKNQQKSMRQSEVMSQVSALTSRIGAIDSQIENQKNLIARYQRQPNLAGSYGMIANAKARIEVLETEKQELVSQRNKLLQSL
jgi:outer membrane murein-binding lipoprotein Lpp